MIHWKVYFTKDYCPYMVTRRKRKTRKCDVMAIILMVSAFLALLIALPAWMIVVLACAVLVSLGMIWLFS